MGDRKLEFMLTDSMSARRFVGLLLYEKAPDYSTICRFRNSLPKDNVTSKIFCISRDFIWQALAKK